MMFNIDDRSDVQLIVRTHRDKRGTRTSFKKALKTVIWSFNVFVLMMKIFVTILGPTKKTKPVISLWGLRV